MKRAATKRKALSGQDEVKALMPQFKRLIERLRTRWLQKNNHPPAGEGLYELDEQARKRVDGVIRRWEEIVTPIAERWWKHRGFGIKWPEKSSETCKIYKLQRAAA